MREDADNALPRLLFFFAQGTAQIREDQQLMRPPVAPEVRPPQLQPSARRTERLIEQSRRLTGQKRRQPQLGALAGP